MLDPVVGLGRRVGCWIWSLGEALAAGPGCWGERRSLLDLVGAGKDWLLDAVVGDGVVRSSEEHCYNVSSELGSAVGRRRSAVRRSCVGWTEDSVSR